MTTITRQLSVQVLQFIHWFPVSAIHGPRQCGKSTLAKAVISAIPGSVYLDLENPVHLARLDDPLAFFELHAGRLICLDEIQLRPDLFSVLRSIVDSSGAKGQVIVLGSASPDLLRQSSETLAGRIGYLELCPFSFEEVSSSFPDDALRRLWFRGGFPDSFLAESELQSFHWRQNYIRTFLTRDIPGLGFRIPANTLMRFWTMCAHTHGQLLNRSKLGESLGVSHHTIQSYLDMLTQTFMLRELLPYEANTKKRLVKSPKIYLRDTGILHTILGINSAVDLLGHPVYGSSWEGMIIENIIAAAGDTWKPFFYRSASGDEIDLILEQGIRRIAIECKASSAPTLTAGFHRALADLDITDAWVIAPIPEAFPMKNGVKAAPLEDFIAYLRGMSAE